MADIESGEIVNGKEVLGETIAKKYCIYGSCYTAVCQEILKYDPISTWHILGCLMLDSEPNTNKVNASNVLLQKKMKRSQRDIARCLSVLRKSQVLVEYEGDEYINPLVWFKGDYAHRVLIFKMLGTPPVLFDDSFYRKEFRIC